jgi:K+-transporting ATPase ATPase A chain
LLPVAIAGFLAQKKHTPQTSGTLLTRDLTFAAMLLGTVLLVGALSFMPAVVLGPVADHLKGIASAEPMSGNPVMETLIKTTSGNE